MDSLDYVNFKITKGVQQLNKMIIEKEETIEKKEKEIVDLNTTLDKQIDRKKFWRTFAIVESGIVITVTTLILIFK